MAKKTFVKVQGLKEVKTALRKLPDATAKNVIRRVLKEVARPIAERARQNAPEDKGDLKESIVVSTKLTKRQRKLHRKPNPSDVEVYVGPDNYPQAIFMEFGTRKLGPFPFLRPAWDALKLSAFHKIKNLMWVQIRKAAARQAKKAAKRGR